MAKERDEAEHRQLQSSVPNGEKGAGGDDPILTAFAQLVGDLSLDLSRATLGPALRGMHDEWRQEAEQLRRDTAEWTSRINASRQHMDQIIQRQHELSQQIYKTHDELLQEMAAFQKERRDQLRWQEEVTSGLARLGELHKALSIESTRTAGIVKDVIGELARFQNDWERRYDLLEERLSAMLDETSAKMRSDLRSVRDDAVRAMETLSKTNEETRIVLGSEINSSRNDIQEIASHLRHNLTESQDAVQQKVGMHADRLEEQIRVSGNRLLGWLAFGEMAIIVLLAYVIIQLLR
ncbi:MAG: hypothetical protein ACOYEP_01900 [Limnochordia bacterium]|jgi:hypothetical protein